MLCASKRSFGYEVTFDFGICFSEVLDRRGGFDVVIANPPYLGEKGNKEIFRLVAVSPLGKRFYKRKMDLFYFFFHLALDITNEVGCACLISTNYWITADGALRLRLDLKTRTTLLQLLSFGELKLFAAAQGQHNMITQMTKQCSNAIARTLVTNRTGEASADVLNRSSREVIRRQRTIKSTSSYSSMVRRTTCGWFQHPQFMQLMALLRQLLTSERSTATPSPFQAMPNIYLWVFKRDVTPLQKSS